MSFENRGGVPIVRRLTAGTNGLGATSDGYYRLPGTTKFLQISNEGANIVRIYFFLRDFVANANYIELAATTGYFEGPVELVGEGKPAGTEEGLYMRSTAATSAVTIVAYMRRG